MPRCWTCKKRRLKCDGATPQCEKCVGHGTPCLRQKPLTWVEGVARRGPMKNRTFSDVLRPMSASGSDRWQCRATKTVPAALVEPLLQDLSTTSRCFIRYYSELVCPSLVFADHQDNEYRQIIASAGFPVVASALVTVAMCHYVQKLTDCPVERLLLPSAESSVIPSHPGADAKHVTREAMLSTYLRSKGHCLRLVSACVANERKGIQDKSLLTAVLLLMVLDMLESGSGAWTLHLEGARGLLDSASAKSSTSLKSSARYLLQEAAIFQTIGSSLAKPGALTSASTLPSTHATGSSAITPIGCPEFIMSKIEVLASQRRAGALFPAQAIAVSTLWEALAEVRSYDISVWAAGISMCDPLVTTEDLAYLGTVWKCAADIYAGGCLCHLTGNSTIYTGPPADQFIMATYSSLEKSRIELVKCLIWPTFVIGAASTKPEMRTWTLRTLERVWCVGHCANTKTAVQVLEVLWDKCDESRRPCYVLEETEPEESGQPRWDWISALSELKGSWLFV